MIHEEAATHIQSRLQACGSEEGPGARLIVSPGGAQFASIAFRARLTQYEFLQSMSRKGNCYDNAPMESFFKSFKVEEIYHNQYETYHQATRAVIEYIERFYNPKRLHSALDYVSPNEFEELRIFEKNKTA